MPPSNRETHCKLQRWTDLIAALLARRFGATFLELARDVPAYAAGLDPAQRETVKRAFERDKDELRDFGIPIETRPPDDDGETCYRLRPTAFYLPYLALPDDGEQPPRPLPPEGYRELDAVTVPPDELDLIGGAVARLAQLGDETLAGDARSAAAKLAFDLPLFEKVNADVRLLDASEVAPALFDVLADAVRRRKVLTFEYRKPGASRPEQRHVEPLGLFFVNAHWYLAARDRKRGDLRNFRVSRMSGAKANRMRLNTPDFDPPPEFDLRAHAQAKEPWDLGDNVPLVAEVRFTGSSGATVAAAEAGDAVAGDPSMRRFPVRRVDAFARWLLPLAGEAAPLSPPELVQQFDVMLRDSLAVYRSAT